MAYWVYDPQSGGIKVPPRIQEDLCGQAESFARKYEWHASVDLKLRFRGEFCYVDTCEKGSGRVFPLCRLRHFDKNNWSLAMFMYSNERYEPCLFSDGQWEGTFEAALEVCEPFVVLE
jgi:hypothetical protein